MALSSAARERTSQNQIAAHPWSAAASG